MSEPHFTIIMMMRSLIVIFWPAIFTINLMECATNTSIACESGTVTINCGTNCLANIITANYGRSDKTTCATTTYPLGSPQLDSTSCAASISTDVLKSNCNAQTTCSVTATTTNFGGDPCHGIYKYLTVTFECKTTVCSNIFASGTGTAPTGPYQVGQTYTFSCNSGYYDASQNTLTPVYICIGDCLADIWSPKNFIPCQKIQCSTTFFTSTTGTAPTSPFYAGVTYNFVCNTNYYDPVQMTQTPQYNCVQSGISANWNPSTFVPCQRIECVNIFQSDTGTIPIGPYLAGQSYQFVCGPNYLDVSQNSPTPTYSCIQSGIAGLWTPAIFTPCIATCPAIIQIVNGSINGGIGSNILGLQTAGNSAAFTCSSGFSLFGLSNLTCLSNGTWEDQAPTCERNCTMTNWAPWSQCSATCDFGVQFRNRSVVEVQTAKGICWNLTEIATCQIDSCVQKLPVYSVILQNIGCAALLSLLIATFILNLILRVRHLERLIHACEEVTLFISHIFIFIFRNSVDQPVACLTASISLQYFMLSCFTFFFLEAVQMYSYVTSVVGQGNFISLPVNMLVGFGLPLVITVPTAITSYKNYVSKFSCWLNIGSNVAWVTIIPICISAWTTVIFVEAAGMNAFRPLMGRNTVKYLANTFNQRGLMAVVITCVIHWFIGFFAIYYGNVALFAAVSATFTSLGVLIFLHHTLCHKVICEAIYKIYLRLSKKSGPMPSWLQSSDNLNKKALKEIRKWMILKKKPIIGEIPPQTEVPPVEQACNNSEKCALIPETFRSEAFWKFSMPNHAEIWLSQVELGYHSTET